MNKQLLLFAQAAASVASSQSSQALIAEAATLLSLVHMS
jgi:hypothetical protein